MVQLTEHDPVTQVTTREEPELEEAEEVEVQRYVFFTEKKNPTIMRFQNGKVVKKAMLGRLDGNRLSRFASLNVGKDVKYSLVPSKMDNYNFLDRSDEINYFLLPSHLGLLTSLFNMNEGEASDLLRQFGIKVYETEQHDNSPLVFYGTPKYAAPEQLARMAAAAPPNDSAPAPTPTSTPVQEDDTNTTDTSTTDSAPADTGSTIGGADANCPCQGETKIEHESRDTPQNRQHCG